MPKLYTTQQAAEILGYYDDSYIRKLIGWKKLKAEKIGRQWLISENAIRRYQLEKQFEQVDKEVEREGILTDLQEAES